MTQQSDPDFMTDFSDMLLHIKIEKGPIEVEVNPRGADNVCLLETLETKPVVQECQQRVEERSADISMKQEIDESVDTKHSLTLYKEDHKKLESFSERYTSYETIKTDDIIASGDQDMKNKAISNGINVKDENGCSPNHIIEGNTRKVLQKLMESRMAEQSDPCSLSCPLDMNGYNETSTRVHQSTQEKSHSIGAAILFGNNELHSGSRKGFKSDIKFKAKGNCVCAVCGKTFSFKSKLQRHMRSHTGEKPFECQICGNKFTQNCSLRQHKEIVHTGSRNFMCDVCGKKLPSNSTLQRHLRSHTGEKPFQCQICGKKYTRNSDLRIHKETIHTVNVTRSSHFKNHKRIHFVNNDVHSASRNGYSRDVTDNKRYMCEVCGKNCSYKIDLQRHMRLHTGEKLGESATCMRCDVCGKTFNYRSALQSHKIIHTSEKPFSCDICGKCFNVKSNARAHRRKHGKPTWA